MPNNVITLLHGKVTKLILDIDMQFVVYKWFIVGNLKALVKEHRGIKVFISI